MRRSVSSKGGQGRLALGNANYVANLRLARRSQERQHPVGVTFGEGQIITEVIRADNDVPSQLWEEEPGQDRVLFQGHDGVFRLRPEHPECARLRTELDEALQQKARVWFIAQKPDLALLDIVRIHTEAGERPGRPGSGATPLPGQGTSVLLTPAAWTRVGIPPIRGCSGRRTALRPRRQPRPGML